MPPKTLENGIPVSIIPVPGTSAVTVLIMVKVGSRFEPAPLSGASHFIEHMMFKGTDKLPTPSDVSRALDAIGADYNAYTSKEYTGYYVKCDAIHQKFAIDTLFDMTFKSKFQEAEMQRERGVIIEEIHMYEDTPVRHIEDLLEGVMFHGNTLGVEIAGTAETMQTMKREDVLAFRDRYYVPSSLSVAVAGSVNEDTLLWLESTFGSVATEGERAEFDPISKFQVYEKTPIAIQKKVTEQVHLGLGFPGLSYTDSRLATMKMLVTILGGNMSSRLFMSVREQGGLAYRIRADHSEYEDVGITSILAGLAPTKLREAIERIFKEVDSMVKDGPTDEEMARTLSYMSGQMHLALEDSSAHADWFAKHALFYDKVETPEERLLALSRVTKDEVRDLAREVFDRKKMTMSYIGSEGDSESLQKLL